MKFSTYFSKTIWNGIVTDIGTTFNNPEYIDNAKAYVSTDALYQLILNQYNARTMRYEPNEFRGYFYNKLIQYLPDMYAKQQAFIKNELNLLAEKANRGNQTKTSNENEGTTNQWFSTSPYSDKVGDDPATAFAKEKIRTTVDATITGTIDAINYIKNAKELIVNADFTTQVLQFLDKFRDLFTQYTNVGTSSDGELSKTFFNMKKILINGKNTTVTVDEKAQTISIDSDGTANFGNGKPTTDQPRAVTQAELDAIETIDDITTDVQAIGKALGNNQDLPEPDKTYAENIKDSRALIDRTENDIGVLQNLPQPTKTIVENITALDDIFTRVKSILQAGNNIQITYNDTSKQITITGTGTGGKTYTGKDGVDVNNTTNIIGFTQDLNDTIGQIGTNKTSISDINTHIGDMGSLNTQARDLVGGINEVNNNAGALTSLTTSDKTNLVDAINEINAKTPSGSGQSWEVKYNQTNYVWNSASNPNKWTANTPLQAGSYKIVLTDPNNTLYVIYLEVNSNTGNGTTNYNINNTSITTLNASDEFIQGFTKTFDTTTTPTNINMINYTFIVYVLTPPTP